MNATVTDIQVFRKCLCRIIVCPHCKTEFRECVKAMHALCPLCGSPWAKALNREEHDERR